MSYYFPFGANASLTVQNIDYTLQAVTASVGTEFADIIVSTASYAPTTQIVPTNGTDGVDRVLADCPQTAPRGPQGLQGAQGAKGAAAGFCPAGTKECPGLHESLSAAWTNGTNFGVNYYRADGARFVYVCIETAGYLASSVTCPDALPTSSNYVIPNIL